MGSQIYTNEEEREATINYLKNRSTAVMEELFTEVVSKARKKYKHKSFHIHNTRSRGRLPN